MNVPKRKNPRVGFNKKSITRRKKGIEQAYFMMLRKMNVLRSVREDMAAEIAKDVLSNYLYERLIFDKGICYDIQSEIFDEYPGYYYFHINSSVDRSMLTRLKKELKLALDDFPKVLTPSRIEEARIAYLRTLRLLEGMPREITRIMAEHYMDGLRDDPFEYTYKNLDKISNRLIKNIAAANFTSDMKFVTLVGDN